ncbi:hypothetical protein L1887_22767 [Cichorium endivia]|nr:hypothetical protein L1887_22767 [Cichorium endivia]
MSNIAFFLLKVGALETVRRLSKTWCPFLWSSLQALQMLCFPPFKWLEKWDPFKNLIKGVQIFSRPLLVLSIATAFTDPSVSENVISDDNETSLTTTKLENQGVSLPERINEDELYRFHSATNGDFLTLVSLVKKSIQWRESYKILSEEELKVWANMVFWHGYDVKNRPCLIIRLVACVKLPSSERSQFAQAIVSQVEHGILHLVNKENPEITVLVDCEGLSIRFPLQLLRSCCAILQENYPGRLGCLFVIRLPPVVRVIAQTFIQVLKPATRKKLKIVGRMYRNALSEYLNSLPSYLGGECTCSKCEKLSNSSIQHPRFNEISRNTDLNTVRESIEDLRVFDPSYEMIGLNEPGWVYEYPDESYLQPSNLETQNWIDRLQELFFLPSEIHTVKYTSLGIADLKPQAKVLWQVGVWNIFPRDGYQKEILVHDISILYGLISGRVALSYAHLVMLNLWATYNKIKYRSSIPNGYLLSRFPDHEGAITTDMEPRWIKIQNRILTQQDIPHLEFSFKPPFHIVDWENRTFVADFEPEEREIVEREKAERVRRREELRNRVQEQVSEYPHRSPKIERGGSRSPSGEESETLNLKKSEKVWSPESCTSCVQGYNVKNIIAPILEAIFVKHGDIAAECQFKTVSLRAGFLEVVCEVVIQLQTNDDTTIISKMEEIESKVSDAETANINVSWLRSHLEDMKMSSLIMETKVKMSMLKKVAEMKVRKRAYL